MNNLVYLIIMWAAALLFVMVGIYSMNRKKPMWLGVGSRISESKITNVKAYNRSIGKMWIAFSALFLMGGIMMYFVPASSFVIFALAGTVGIGVVIWWQHKIEEKYLRSR